MVFGDERPPDEPASLAELLWYIRRYDTGIFVREQIDGKWCSVSIDELPPDLWGKHVARFIQEGILPVRVLEPSERPKEAL